MPDEITTTAGMINRRHTQDTPQQVRKREALAEASLSMAEKNGQAVGDNEEMLAALNEIDSAIEAIGNASLKLASGERLAGFLSNVALCRMDVPFLRDEQMELLKDKEEQRKLDEEEDK